MELYLSRSYAFLFHEEISPIGWRGMLLFVLLVIIFVKLVDGLAGRVVRRGPGNKRSRKSNRSH